jgi:AI-2 transport protein TqsA
METKNKLPDVSIYRPIIILSGLIIVLAAMVAASTVVAALFLCFFIALFFLPLRRWMVSRRVPSWLAMLIIIAILFLLIAGIFGLLFISSRQLFQNLAANQINLNSILQPLLDSLSQFGIPTASLGLSGEELQGRIMGALGGFLTEIFASGIAWITIGIVIIVAVIMLLAEAEGYFQRLQDSVGAGNPAFAVLRDFAHDLMRWLIVRAQVNVIVTAAVAIMLLALNVEGALIWSILAFFLGFIPYLGLALAAFFPSLLTFVQQGLTSALLLGLGYFIISTISENILRPKVLGYELNVSPAYFLLSEFVLGWLMGIPGILLSGPLAIFFLLVFSLFKETSWITDMVVTRTKSEIPE